MIPVVLLRGIEPVTAASQLGGERADALRLLPQLDPGEILSARIESKLPDGSFKVMVAGQEMRMVLPSNLSAGDSIDLTFIAREPRLTFALREGRQAEAMPAPQLSAAGRLVASTMLRPGELPQPLAASAAAPLLAAPPADGTRLSGLLTQTVAESGLFYESHQAEWVAGKRDLSQIRQEPQARLARIPEGPEARLALKREDPQSLLKLSTALPDASGISSAGASTSASATAPGNLTQSQDQTIHPRTIPLVQQQLAALDTSRVMLQLEIWPNQWLQWEIDDQPPGTESNEDIQQTWNTRLHLDLPQLGELKASLSLNGDGVHIRLETANDTSASLLRANTSSLHAALASAGVPPTGIAIDRHGQD